MKNLEAALQVLAEKNVVGVSSYARVSREMEDVSLLMPKVSIVYNNKFSLEYDHEVKEFTLGTTYSNQIVDADFIEELNVLNHVREMLNKEVV